MTKKYAIFLDIDGVFTSRRVHAGHTCSKAVMWDKFDSVAIDFLNKLDDQFYLDFVIMSTWKNGVQYDNSVTFHWMVSSFRNAGFRGNFPWPYWKTDPLEELASKRGERAYEVKDYLEKYGSEYQDYLLFDDTRYNFDEILGRKRHIRTCPIDGLLFKQMEKTLSMVGQWQKRI